MVAFNDGHDDVTDDELRAAAAQRIARFKLPKGFVRVPTVVRSPAGKADYRWAREIAVGDLCVQTEVNAGSRARRVLRRPVPKWTPDRAWADIPGRERSTE